MINTNKLIKDIEKIKNQIQKIPSQSDYEKYGSFSSDTFNKRFGSWNKALMAIFGEVVQIRYPNKPIIKCLNCEKETKNPKYCSRSCAAMSNNKLFPKRQPYPRKKCLNCDKEIRTKSQYCRKCYSLLETEKFGEKMIKDFTSTYARHKYQNIRHHAHRIAKYHNIPKKCFICDYKLHIELCHKKSIHKFDKNTKLNIVNDLKNLIYLCKNHHWELDHNYLKI